MTCLCGHDRHFHDFFEGCKAFLCCNRKRSTFPGQRHTEHDGIAHRAKPCLCKAFTEQELTA